MKSWLIIIFISFSLPSTPQDTISVYGNTGLDRGINIVKTRTGYIATGITTDTATKENGLVLFYDQQLKIKKAKHFGGDKLDFLWGIAETNDEGYLITGFTYSFGNGGSDAWIVRLNANGDTLWTKTFGGAKDERAVSIIRSSDGNFIITGETYSYGNGDRDVLLIKITDRGEILWTKTFGSVKSDRGFYTIENSSKNLVICGITENNVNGDIDSFIKCCDKDGNELWHKTYGSKGTDVFHAMAGDEKDNIVLAGYREYKPGLHHPWIVKLDANGEIISDTVLNINADSRIMNFYIKNKQLVATGYTKKTPDSDWDILLLKAGFNGKFNHKVYQTDKPEQGYRIIPYQNNSSLVIGHSLGIRNKDGDLVILNWDDE